MTLCSRSRAVQVRLMLLALASPAILAASCATEPPPRAARLDPSSPGGTESRPFEVSAADASAPAMESAPEDHSAAAPSASSVAPPGPALEHAPAAAAAVPAPAPVYVCPMHPEVTSAKPGKCPKCGMQLVLKPAAPPTQGKGHHHEHGASVS